jgi:hypothetical protein
MRTSLRSKKLTAAADEEQREHPAASVEIWAMDENRIGLTLSARNCSSSFLRIIKTTASLDQVEGSFRDSWFRDRSRRDVRIACPLFESTSCPATG